MNSLFCQAGDELYCKQCETLIAKAARDLFFGAPMKFEDFEWLSHKYVSGEEAVCFKCGACLQAYLRPRNPKNDD